MGDVPGFSPGGRDLCRYRCESRAYQTHQAHGVCDKGYVHDFYGIFKNIDPSLHGSSLESFEEDKRKPCATLLEYLHGSESFSGKGFCQDLFVKAIAGLEEIHGASVIHNDSRPRNILTLPGYHSPRAVWTDFYVSIVFSGDTSSMLELDLKGEADGK